MKMADSGTFCIVFKPTTARWRAFDSSTRTKTSGTKPHKWLSMGDMRWHVPIEYQNITGDLCGDVNAPQPLCGQRKVLQEVGKVTPMHVGVFLIL